MKAPSHRISVALFIVTLLSIVNAQAQTKQSQTLTLGVVFQAAREPVEKHFRPFVDYTARKLSPSGDTKGIVVVAPFTGQMRNS